MLTETRCNYLDKHRECPGGHVDHLTRIKFQLIPRGHLRFLAAAQEREKRETEHFTSA
jgi:hypothetical protein